MLRLLIEQCCYRSYWNHLRDDIAEGALVGFFYIAVVTIDRTVLLPEPQVACSVPSRRESIRPLASANYRENMALMPLPEQLESFSPSYQR